LRADLPAALTSTQAWVACIADARPLDEIASLLEDAGLIVETTERHDDALVTMLDRIDARLKVARLLGGVFGARVISGQELVAAAHEAVADGVLGYCVVIARKP